MNKHLFSFVIVLNLLTFGTSVQISAENLFYPTSTNEQTTTVSNNFFPLLTPGPAGAPAVAVPPLPADPCSATCGTVTADGKVTYCTGNGECTPFGCFDYLWPGSLSGAATICVGGTAPTIGEGIGNAPATYVEGNGNSSAITYTWVLNGATVTTTTTATFTPSGTVTTTPGIYTYTREVTDGKQDKTIAAGSYVLTVVDQPTVTAATATQSICYNTAPAAMTATPRNGHGSASYQWYSGSSAGAVTTPISGATANTYQPGALTVTTYYNVVLTQSASGCAATATPATVTVYPPFNPGTVTTGSSTLCVGGTPTAISADAASGGNGAIAYTWYKDGAPADWSGVGASYATYTPPASHTAVAGTYVYTRMAQSADCAPATSTGSYVLTVVDKPTITVTAAESICYNTVPTAMTATSSNGYGASSYQWQSGASTASYLDISGATATTYAPSSLMTTTYYRVLLTQSGSGCAETANGIAKTVYPEFNPGTVTAGSSTVCVGGTPPTISATTASGGNGAITYTWYKDGVPANWWGVGDSYATYTPPTIYTAATGTSVYTREAKSADCAAATSTGSYVLTVDDRPTVTVSPSSSICYNETPAMMTALALRHGETSYQWYSGSSAGAVTTPISGATTNTYQPGALTVTTYYNVAVRQGDQSAGCTATATAPAIVTVYPEFNPGTVTGTSTVCVGGTPPTISATTASGGHGAITYTWYASGTITHQGEGDAYATYAPSTLYTAAPNTYIYTRVAQSACGTATSTGSYVLTVVVGPTVTLSTPAPICENGTPTAMTATVSGGHGDASYQWYSGTSLTAMMPIAQATNSIYQPGALTKSTYFKVDVTKSGSGCASSPAESQPIEIIVYPLPSVSSITNGQACASTATSTEVLIAASAGSNVRLDWYSASSGGSSTYSGASYMATVSNPAAGTTSSRTFYVEPYDFTTNCRASSRTPVVAYVNARPATPSTVTVSNVCEGSTLTFSVPGGATTTYGYDWTGSSPSGTYAGNNHEHYWYRGVDSHSIKVRSAQTYNNGSGLPMYTCHSSGTISASAEIYANPAAPTTITSDASGGRVCAGGTITFTTTLSSSSYGYNWSASTPTPLEPTASSYVRSGPAMYAGLIITPAVRATETHGTLICNSSILTGTAATVFATPTQPVLTSSATSVCQAEIILTASSGTNTVTEYHWYKDGNAAPHATTTSSTYAATVTGTYTVAAVNGSCESPKSAPLFLHIETSMPGSVELDLSAGVYQEGCGYVPLKISASGPTYSAYQWYKNKQPIPGANAPSYSVAENDLGRNTYTVAGVNAACIGSPSNGEIVVDLKASPWTQGPVITNNGTHTQFACDADITLTCIPLAGASSYVWYRAGIEVSRGAATTYLVHDDPYGVYTVRALDGNCQSPSSEQVTVIILKRPDQAKWENGDPVTLCYNDTYVLNVIAANAIVAPANEYVWYRNGEPAGTTSSSSYTIPARTNAGAHSYTVLARSRSNEMNGQLSCDALSQSAAKPVTIMPEVDIKTSTDSYNAISGRAITPIALEFTHQLGGTATCEWKVIEATFPSAYLTVSGSTVGTSSTISGIIFTFTSAATAATSTSYPVQVMATASYTLNGVTCTGSKTLTIVVNDSPKPISLSAKVKTPLPCIDNATTEIILEATNGESPYQYSKDGQHWVSSNELTGYTAGIHKVYAKDNKGVEASTYVEVKQPAKILAEADIINLPTGMDRTDGKVKIRATGGTAPPYLYRNATTGVTQDGDTMDVKPGTYTFYVTDNDLSNCPGTATASVDVNIGFTVFAVQPVCAGSGGTITVIAHGGNGTFSYSATTATTPSWQNGTSATYVYPSLAAGTYNVTVASAGFTATPQSIVINNVSAVTATVATSPVTCNGAADGKAIITAGGGAGNYSYSRNGLDYTGNYEITGLGAGTHVLFVRDAHECQSSVTAHITQPSRLTVTAEVTRNITYAGGNNAEVTATATGGSTGTPGYHYSKEGHTWIYNSNVIPGYGAGAGKVYARDANNCVAEAAVYVGSYTSGSATPLNVIATVSKSLSCFGQSDAEIMITAQGGQTPYTYKREGGTYASTATLTGFPAGTHKVYVKDAAGTEESVWVTVQPVQPLTAYAQVFYNGTTAQAVVVAEGGAAPYSYKLDNGAGQNSDVFTVAAGAHTITVSDANNCTAAPVYLNVGNNPNEVTLTASITRPLACADGTGAAIMVRVTGGTGLSYQFSHNGGTYQPGGLSFEYTNIGAGAHTFTAKDDSGTLSNPVVVQVSSAASSITVAATATVNTCDGTNNGEVVINATGGVPALQYSLNSVDYQLSGTFTNVQLAPGSVRYVYVKDAVGCVKGSTVTVPAVSSESLQLAIIKVTNPTAINANDGIIVAKATGGLSSSYTYTSNGGTAQSSGTFTGLAPNTYTVKVTDTQCTAEQTVILGATVDALSLNAVIQDPKCSDGNSGVITVYAWGGSGTYSYSLDGVIYQNGNVFNGLTAGEYTVYVKDTQTPPATATISVLLTAAQPVTVTTSVEHLAGNKVTLRATAAGGWAPYSYRIDGVTSSTAATATGVFTDLLANTDYTVIVRDKNGCEGIAVVNTGGNGQPTVTLRVVQQPLCADSQTGEVEVQVSGGKEPYRYSSNNIDWQEMNILTGLGAGLHTVFVKETVSGRVTKATITLTAPEALTVKVADITAASSASATDGAIRLEATGGKPAYRYSANYVPYQASPQITGLKADYYTAYVMDANGCYVSVPAVVGNSASTSLNIWAQVIGDNSCNAKAKVVVVVQNSTNVEYAKKDKQWDTSGTLTDFASGLHWVYARDKGTGRIDSVQVTIKSTAAIQALAYATARVSSPGAADGEFTIYAIGGKGAYQYAIGNSVYQSSPVFSDLKQGVYTFHVKDAEGCTTTVTGVMKTVDIIIEPVAVKVTENGTPANYTVHLSDAPTATVGLVTEVENASATATPGALTFAAADVSRKLMTVAAVDNSDTDGDRTNRVTHASATVTDTRYANLERHVLVTVQDDERKDCDRFLQSVKEGFVIRGKNVRSAESYCLAPGQSVPITIKHRNGVFFKWTIAKKNGTSLTAETYADSLAATHSGTYTVRVTDQYGCTAESDAMVLYYSTQPAQPLFPNTASMLRPKAGGQQVYRVNNPDTVVYHWTLPTDWKVAAGANDTASAVPVLVGYNAGTVCVTATDSLGLCKVEHACIGVNNFKEGEIDVIMYPTMLTDEENSIWVRPQGFNVTGVMVINNLGTKQTFDIPDNGGSTVALIDKGKTARIRVQNLSSGHYFFIFKGTEGQSVSKLLLKE
jgi:hypothetical protein